MNRLIVIQRMCFFLFVFIICHIGESEALARSARSPTTTPRPVSKKDACDFWRQFTEQMNNISKVYSYLAYNCTYDPDKCHGADCTGAIRYKLQGMNLINISFCFGMRINHCDSPISVDMYYTNSNNNSSAFVDRIYHQDSKPLKNLDMDLGNVGKAEPYLFFNLTRPVPHHVLFGIRAKVKLTSSFFHLESWPSQYQQDIIPNTEIPVTPCPAKRGNTTVPRFTEPKCVHVHHISPPPTTAMTTMNPHIIKSATFSKPCDISSMSSCGTNEMCSGSESNASCVCAPQHPFDKTTGFCSGKAAVLYTTPYWILGMATSTPTVIHHKSQPHTGGQSKDSGSSSKPAMIGGIVAGVVFLLIVVIVGVLVCRRYRSNRPYIGRLLLDDDESDNVI